MTDGVIASLLSAIARGELESQAEQSCAHSRLSGPPMSGFCLDCGDDIMVRQVEEYLAKSAQKDGT
jgi:hypothetical protein